MILKKPGIEKITAEEIAQVEDLQVLDVEITLYNMAITGSFFSSARHNSTSVGISEIELKGDNAYDAYLKFTTIDDLLEKQYQKDILTLEYDDVSIPFSRSNVLGGMSKYYPESKLNTKTKKNTAFVLMAISPEIPELEDIYQTIKNVCLNFGIKAYRADEIEHQDRITDLILSEISLCEYLIADLSYERPNVYYEIGYSHALEKKPILYRKKDTKLHFDLAVHNVPEYKNITELKEMLTKRFEAILGRSAKSSDRGNV